MATPRVESPEHPERRTTHQAVLAVALLFVLVTIAVSTGLLVYTAWIHDAKNGLFAILFAVLSSRTAISWVLWQSHAVGSSKPK